MVTAELMVERIRRGFFLILTLFCFYVIYINIYASWFSPAPQTKLDRLQTDLVMQAINNDHAREFLGQDLIKAIYQRSLDDYLQVKDQSEVIYQVGLLYIKNDRIEQALSLWRQEDELAQVLSGLWQTPPRISPNAEKLIKQNLDGWYEYYALRRLYEVSQSPSLAVFEFQQTIESQDALLRLLSINLIPIGGSLIGIGTIIFYLIRLRKYNSIASEIPWQLETVWQVMVSWFFCYTLIAQFLPRVLKLWLGSSLTVAITYLLSMMPIFAIFALHLRQFPNWHKIILNVSLDAKSIYWALGGYTAAIPTIVAISLGQQIVLRGHGGGNPLLEIITQSQGLSAILVFWLTLGVSAPLLEEIIFRGFLFPSLTKYCSRNLSLCLSAFLFALVHMNINDILPLTTLGLILGLVYDRSRNLLTPILLHCFWNTGSFISLLLISY
jgi:membrane protease YdiL (CAAX protease family)